MTSQSEGVTFTLIMLNSVALPAALGAGSVWVAEQCGANPPAWYVAALAILMLRVFIRSVQQA